MTDGVIGYRILGLVGEGGFGKVYRARQESTGGFTKEVALKILHDPDAPRSLLGRFRDEARILGLIRDRAIVKVEPPVLLEGSWAVVMEYVDGDSLRSVIDHEGRLPPAVALEVVEEVARALDNAFHQDIDGEPLQLLHRDIKPDNIQITPSGEVRLLDFGIAKANFQARETKTRKGFGGTPGYIGPERLEGIDGPEGDIYSLGVVLYEAIVGERSRGATDVEMEDDLPRIDTEELDLPDDLTDDMRQAIELSGWMRAGDHDVRPTARQVEDACRALRSSLSGVILRDWAREAVPKRRDLPPDHRVGQLYEVSTGVATPAPAPRREPVSLPPPLPTNDSSRTLAMGGLMAGGLGLGLGLGLVGLALAILLAVVVMLVDRPSEDVVDTPEPRPVPELPVPVDQPEPVPEPVVVPEPVEEPEPVVDPAPAPAPTVIRLPGSRDPDPAPAPVAPAPVAPAPVAPAPVAPAPEPTRAMGTLRVRTIPSGATVKRAGQTLQGAGGRYELPVGSHSVTVVSPQGEEAYLPITIHRDKVLDICYDFDRNKACGG